MHGAGTGAGGVPASGTSISDDDTKELWQKLPHFLYGSPYLEAFFKLHFSEKSVEIASRSSLYMEILNQFFPFVCVPAEPAPPFKALEKDLNHFISMIAVLDVLHQTTTITIASTIHDLPTLSGYIKGISPSNPKLAAFYTLFELVSVPASVQTLQKALYYLYVTMNVDQRIARLIPAIRAEGVEDILMSLQPQSAALGGYHEVKAQLIGSFAASTAKTLYDNPLVMQLKTAIDKAQAQMQYDSGRDSRADSFVSDRGLSDPDTPGVEMTTPRLLRHAQAAADIALSALLIRLSPSMYQSVLTQTIMAAFPQAERFTAATSTAVLRERYNLNILDIGIDLLNYMTPPFDSRLTEIINAQPDKNQFILNAVMPLVVQAYCAAKGIRDRSTLSLLKAIFTLRMSIGADDREQAQALLTQSSLPYKMIIAFFTKMLPTLPLPDTADLKAIFYEKNHIRAADTFFMDQFFDLTSSRRASIAIQESIPKEYISIALNALHPDDQTSILRILFSINFDAPPDLARTESILFDGKNPLIARRILEGVLAYLGMAEEHEITGVIAEIPDQAGHQKPASVTQFKELAALWLAAFERRDDRHAGCKEIALLFAFVLSLALTIGLGAKGVDTLQDESIEEERWHGVPLVNLIEVGGITIAGSTAFGCAISLALKLMKHPLSHIEQSRLQKSSRWNYLMPIRRISAGLSLAVTTLAISNIWEWLPRALVSHVSLDTLIKGGLTWYWGINTITDAALLTLVVSTFIDLNTRHPFEKQTFFGRLQNPFSRSLTATVPDPMTISLLTPEGAPAPGDSAV